MNKISGMIRDHFKLIGMILVGTYAILEVVLSSVYFMGGEFGPVMGGLLRMCFFLILAGAYIVAIILKKQLAAKVIAIIFVAATFMDTISGFVGAMSAMVSYNTVLNVFVAIFESLVFIGLFGMGVIYILGAFFEKLVFLRKINNFVGLGVLGMSVLAFILGLIACIVDKDVWFTYVNLVNVYLVFIPMILFLYFIFLNGEVKLEEAINYKLI